jgi:hypothetical protein
MDTVHGQSLQSFSPYVVTQCTTCEAGWTRKDEHGRMVIVCLLDREPVWPKMVACDRFAARAETADAH